MIGFASATQCCTTASAKSTSGSAPNIPGFVGDHEGESELASDEWLWLWLVKKTEQRIYQLLYQKPAECAWSECGGRVAAMRQWIMEPPDLEDVPHKGAGHQPPHFGSKEGRDHSQQLPM